MRSSSGSVGHSFTFAYSVGGHLTLDAVRPCFEKVDGLLIMLIEPGSTDAADPALSSRAGQARPCLPTGVDGGVDEANLGTCLDAGARYIVSGRALLSAADAPKGGTPEPG